MKTGFLHLTFLFFTLLCAQAQKSLPESPRKSAESYIYTISKDNLRKIYLKDDDITEKMLERQVAKYQKGKGFPTLSRGNYVIVDAIENKLRFTDYIVDDLYFKVVHAEKMRLCLYDSLGKLITDATVKCGSKQLKYDKKTQT